MIPAKIKELLKKHGLEHLTEAQVKAMHEEMGFRYQSEEDGEAVEEIVNNIMDWANGTTVGSTNKAAKLDNVQQQVFDDITSFLK